MSSSNPSGTPEVGEGTPSVSTKLPLTALIALGVGGMIGGGIFHLPAQMAGAAAPGPLIIGWLITGLGMVFLSFVFQHLANNRPDVDGGVYGYARAGFGDFVGYMSAWSYWISAWVGNLGYLVLLVTTIGIFIPGLGKGDALTIPGIIVASIIMWLIHFLILRGVREAAFVNVVVTIAKIVPLILFVICGFIAFKMNVFTADFWGNAIKVDGEGLGSSLTQIKNMMLVTVWVFIGIEGAAIYSKRAAKRSDVGKATVTSFVIVIALLILVNLLSYGVMAQPEIAKQGTPSLAAVMEEAVGHPWGRWVIAIGLIISLLGALLTWIMLAAEILFVPAEDHNLPSSFGNTNEHQSPTTALWVTSITSQVVLLLSYVWSNGYNFLILLAASVILPCYLISALFQLKAARSPWGYTIGIVATIYTVWLVIAGGSGYLLLDGIVWIVGVPLYIYARKKAGKKPFVGIEYFYLAVVCLLAIGAIVALANAGWSIDTVSGYSFI